MSPSGHARLPISVIIPTHNEEGNLAACLRSVQEWAGEMFVVDSGSTDRTRQIAAEFGATVVRHPFETHARQWAWAFDHLSSQHEWVLGLDADQWVTPDLAEELRLLFTAQPARLESFDGFYISRRQIFRGRWIRYGGYYPKYLLKLFRRAKVRVRLDDLVDHHFYVDGPTARLQHDLVEENKKEDEIAFWIAKHNRYATLLAQEELYRRRHRGGPIRRARFVGTPDEQTRWMKRIWWGLPLYLRPFLYFVYRYVLLLGFLDGKEGLIFHFLQGCWFRFLVDVNLDGLEAGASGPAVTEADSDYSRH